MLGTSSPEVQQTIGSTAFFIVGGSGKSGGKNIFKNNFYKCSANTPVFLLYVERCNI
jgi:hypothetical protein